MAPALPRGAGVQIPLHVPDRFHAKPQPLQRPVPHQAAVIDIDGGALIS
ncbi:hypothetical protein PVT67_09015 [Gallaecimonas kandeliae]|nr:hypothetical protein [Gallaecimonas kandeliae]WKE67351.1 hypothetical protein PVT67_09015 [Gallaecimonas kandeliae]